MIMPAKKTKTEMKPQTEKKVKSADRQPKAVSRELEPWDILIYPHLAEKSMKMVEGENKLVFIVRRNSSKKQIKDAIEKAFNVKVNRVNFEITARGRKRLT